MLRFVLAFVNPREATPSNLRSDDREHGSLAEGEARLELGGKWPEAAQSAVGRPAP